MHHMRHLTNGGSTTNGNGNGNGNANASTDNRSQANSGDSTVYINPYGSCRKCKFSLKV
jgi:hypothetical protein